MRTYCDLDGTLCSGSYKNGNIPTPIQKNIDKLNRLYDRGDYIFLWTARGMETYNQSVIEADHAYRKVTEKWLAKYGVKYNKLLFGKPSYDKIIDDKSENWSDDNKQ